MHRKETKQDLLSVEIKSETVGGTMVGFLGSAVLGVVLCYVVTSSPACVPKMLEKEEERKKNSYKKNGRREEIRRFVYPCVQHFLGLGVCAGKQTKQGQVSSYPLSKRQMSNNHT